MPRVSLVVTLFVAGIARGDWQHADVPVTLGPAGAVASANGEWTLSGAGIDIWNRTDEFHFLFESAPVAGNFALACRVKDFAVAPNAWSKIGLMVRGGTPPFVGAESYAYALLSRDNGAWLQFRDGSGELAQNAADDLSRFAGRRADVWLALVRDGAAGAPFRGYAALRPPFWLPLGECAVAALEGRPLYAGLAVTSHQPGELATAIVDAVTLSGEGVSPGVGIANLACFVDGPNVHLAWDDGGASFARIAVAREDEQTGAFADLPEVSGTATSLVDAPGPGMWRYWLAGFDGARPTAAVYCSTVVDGPGACFIDSSGYIRSWLVLGPLARTGGADPGALVWEDYLGSEATALPAAGDTLLVSGASTTGVIGPTPNGWNPDAGVGTAEWRAYHAPAPTLDHAACFGTAYDNSLVYHVCYLENATAGELALDLVAASDDTAAVMLDNAPSSLSFWSNWTERAHPCVLVPGVHRLTVKVFNGGGPSGLRLRLRDAASGEWIRAGDGRVKTSLAPRMTQVPPAPSVSVRRYMDNAFARGVTTRVTLVVKGGAADVMERVPATMAVMDAGGGAVNGRDIVWREAQGALTYKVMPVAVGGEFAGIARDAAANVWFGYFGPQHTAVFPAAVGEWYATDIAAAGLQGATMAIETAPGVHTMQLTGSGHDIWDAKDDFRFAWKEWPANRGVIVQARLEAGSFWVTREANDAGTVPNVWAKAGIMFRAVAERGSPYTFAFLREGQGTPDPSFQLRASSDALAQQLSYWGDNTNVTLPHWIRLEYRFGTVTAAFTPDADGVPDDAAWRTAESAVLELEGAPKFLIGFAVSSHNNNQAVSCTFSNVTVQAICEPARVVRTWQYAGTPGEIQGNAVRLYRDGEGLAVTLTLSELRRQDEGCDPIGTLRIREKLPPGWTATAIDAGGQFAAGEAVWNLSGTQLVEGMTLRYVASGTIPHARVRWDGEYDEILPRRFGPFPIAGETVLHGEEPVDATGGIESWLLLGPYEHDVLRPLPAPVPAASLLARDYLTDGVVTEADVVPAAGAQLRTNYGLAASLRLVPVISNSRVNPGGVPAWFPWRQEGARVSFQAPGIFGAHEGVMAYAACVLEALHDMDVVFAVRSDDAVQVLLDGASIHINSVLRAYDGAAPDNVPATLSRGVHRLMLKVFEADGEWEFSVAVLGPDGATPIKEGLRVCLDPAGCTTAPARVFLRVGDTNSDGMLNIADAIALLAHLFAAGKAPACRKAADANDDNSLDIADAIVVLGYLFNNGAMRAPDGTAVHAGNHPGCAPYAPEEVDTLPASAEGCEAQCLQ